MGGIRGTFGIVAIEAVAAAMAPDRVAAVAAVNLVGEVRPIDDSRIAGEQLADRVTVVIVAERDKRGGEVVKIDRVEIEGIPKRMLRRMVARRLPQPQRAGDARQRHRLPGGEIAVRELRQTRTHSSVWN